MHHIAFFSLILLKRPENAIQSYTLHTVRAVKSKTILQYYTKNIVICCYFNVIMSLRCFCIHTTGDQLFVSCIHKATTLTLPLSLSLSLAYRKRFVYFVNFSLCKYAFRNHCIRLFSIFKRIMEIKSYNLRTNSKKES